MNKLPTIKLKGKDYVQVKDRIVYFNETYPAGSIFTEIVTSSDKLVTFKAIVVPDIEKPHRYFTGHAFGTVDEVKAFEKLETVSVGRALALMGIGVLDSVASADEMQRFEGKQAPVKSVAPKIPVCSDYLLETLCNTGEFTLDSGVSKNTGKPWYMVVHKGQKYWINESQHRILSK